MGVVGIRKRPSVRFTELLLLCAIVAIACASCALDGLLHSSVKLDEYKLSTEVVPDSLRTQVEFYSGSELLYGFYVKQPDSNRVQPHPIVIMHHGHEQHLGRYWNRVELFFKAGFDVFIYDYRGYGRSTGVSTEQSLATDAAAALRYVGSRSITDTLLITHYGHSFGSFNALYSASELHRARSVIVESAFADADVLVRSATLLDVPARYLLEGSYNNLNAIKRITVPVLIIHGTADVFVDYEKNARALYSSANNPKVLIPVAGAGHNNVPQVMGERQYIDLITVFVRGL
jgi:pimeloyl-ACP methyl ester carboxylesterase